jgi:uncharacterized protein
LVTGASSGIGAAFAERLGSDGWDLILVARRQERLDALGKSLHDQWGIDARSLVADLTDPEQIATVAASASVEPRLEMLFNNAGFSGYTPFVSLPDPTIDDMIKIHCGAAAHLSRAALPGMIERGSGSIINMASLLAFSQSVPPDPLPHRVIYAACKAFLVTFTVTLRHELVGTGVRATVCCPGLVESEFHGDAFQGPPQMPADLVVHACLAGLKLDEPIVTPSLEDATLVESLHEAQRNLLRGSRGTDLASRYRV